MSRWRIVVVAALLVLPFVALAGLGSVYLWRNGWALYAWWPLVFCMGAGYFLAWHWQRRRTLLRPPDFESPTRWTERDAQAWKLVEARTKAAAELPVAKLSDVNHFLDTAREMAQELATFYHPRAQDPVGNLTVPEVLAVVELAAHDLAVLVDHYLPGGHLLTIGDWRRARQFTEWYQTASNIYWSAAALFSPVETGIRYAASRLGLSMPMQLLQQHLFLWFYTAYVHRLGTYLIDLNSGRLRVGADRFRQLFGGQAPDGTGAPAAVPGAEQPDDEAIERVSQVTVTLLGQVKAGKSSLVNGLLGEQRARTDVLPVSDNVQSYELHSAGIPTRLVLLDTQGYGHTGPKADQIKATQNAARQSDLLLLVLHARNPARQADVEMLQGLRAWFASQPDLKRPPVLAVLTHVDLLSPAMEWAPPYDWQEGTRPKEASIRAAVAAVTEQLGDLVAEVVPVCLAPGRVYGVEEWLLPAIAERLDEVRGVALLRCLRAEVNKERMRKVFRQLLATGKAAARIAWDKFREGTASKG
jgi:predicted GTPase